MTQADEDLRLLQDCLADNPGAWEAFVRRFAPYLAEACRRTLRRCRRPCGSQEVADMLQTAFLTFVQEDLRVLRAYQGRGSLASYLAAIAVRRVIDDPTLPTSEVPPPGLPPEPIDPAGGPPEAAEGLEAQGLLHQALEALSPRARLALVLRMEGTSLQDMAGILGMSEEAAAQVLSRARAQLRERLKRE